LLLVLRRFLVLQQVILPASAELVFFPNELNQCVQYGVNSSNPGLVHLSFCFSLPDAKFLYI